MRIAVLSDIHGNVRGLDACLADLDAQGGADLLIAAGDLCMDGPRPVEVLERLSERSAVCVRGNTDREIVEYDASRRTAGMMMARIRKKLRRCTGNAAPGPDVAGLVGSAAICVALR